MAQVTDFNQHGRATQELRAAGLSIAHPSLPLNSRIMVANTLTGQEIEATVVGRILASTYRIADLSPDAWRDLELSEDSEIRIYTSPHVLPRPIVAVSPQVEPASEATSLPVQDATDPEITARIRALETWVVLHSPDPEVMNRLRALEAREREDVPRSADPEIIERLAALEAMVTQYRPDPEITARLAALEARPEVQEAVEVREVVNIQPAAPVVLHVHPQVTQHVPHFVVMPRVIPGLPDPNTGRTYRLQVGAFSVRQTADRVSWQLSSLGFNVAQEWTGAVYRVLATDVPAAMVSPAIQRLGTIGIEQVWVRD